jgi:hypothetical protein
MNMVVIELLIVLFVVMGRSKVSSHTFRFLLRLRGLCLFRGLVVIGRLLRCAAQQQQPTQTERVTQK